MRLRPLLVALVAACLATTAHADFKRSYAKGVDAYGEGKLDEAEKLFKEALAEEATPQAKVKLYGMRFEPYVPQFYLGMMAYKRGDCAGAMRYWETPGVSAVVGNDGALSGPAQSGERDCKTKLAGAGTSTTTVATTTPTTTTTTPVEPPPKPPQPNNTSTTASTRPTGSETVASNTHTTSVTPPPKPPTPTPTPTPAAEAPADLVSALDNFLSGRYAQAASIDPGKLGDPRARYHALLVRAAARHVLSLLQGEAGAALLAQAQSDVRAAKALQPSASPDASVFSPRFRQFYMATR